MVERVERIIQWYGLIRFPPSVDIGKVHWYRIILDRLRDGPALYENAGVYQPARQYAGTISAMRDRRVIENADIDFRNRVCLQFSNAEMFLHRTISCSLDATLKSIANLGFALGAIPIEIINPIRSWKPYALVPDEFSVRMVAESFVIRVQLEWDYLPTCPVLPGNEEPSAPEEPPPIPPPPPDGAEIEISPPYEGVDDEGWTYNPGQSNDFPVGQQCTIYRVNIEVTFDGTNYESRFGFYFGPIRNVFLENQSVIVSGRGRIDLDDCSGEIDRPLVSNNVVAFRLISIEEFTP